MRIQRFLLQSLWKAESQLGRKLALSTLLTLHSNSELPSCRLHIHELLSTIKRGKKSNNSSNNKKGINECGGTHKAINNYQHLMIHYNIQPFAQILKTSCLDLNFSFLPLFASCSSAWIFFLSLILCQHLNWEYKYRT